jgi:hypothetical protein
MMMGDLLARAHWKIDIFPMSPTGHLRTQIGGRSLPPPPRNMKRPFQLASITDCF